jgi:adenosylhomocysteine nucleosidase
VTSVLVLTAIDLEARAIARDLGLSPVPGRLWPHFRSGAIEVACVGLRASCLDERAEAFAATDLVIAAGACGALTPALAAGALVVPEVVVAPGGDRLVTDVVAGLTRAGTLLTSDDVVETAEMKARLWLETGAVAVDMESATIVRWARGRGVRAAVVRGVSDTAGHGVPADLAAVVASDGRVSTTRAARTILARPAALGQALALRRGTTTALRAVASTLATLARSRPRA